MPRLSLLVLLFFSVYVSLSKNSFFMLMPKLLSESGCKGTTFFRNTKLFTRFFSKKQKVFALIDNAKTSIPYYIYKFYSLFPKMRSR